MTAAELNKIASTYVYDETKEYVFKELIEPSLINKAKMGLRELSINNFKKDEYDFKKFKEEHNLLSIKQSSLAEYCKYQLIPLLESKGFKLSWAEPLYFFRIRF